MQISQEAKDKIKDKELHRIATTVTVYKPKENKQFTYLITKRALHKKMMPGKWTVPGGGLNVDDYISKPQTHGDNGWPNSVETAMLREINEEVNIKIGEAKYLLNLTFIRPDAIPVLVLTFYAPYVSGEVKLDQDSVEYKWVNIEEAKSLDIIPGIYDELVMVDELLKSGK